MYIDRCRVCPRECSVSREAHRGSGVCGMGADAVVARAMLHQWEEPIISGQRGSGTVFFSGCPLCCVYCQNAIISHDRFGKIVNPSQLRAVMERLIDQGAHNINLVNPTHFVPAILEALVRPLPVPVVYNSSGYERAQTIRALEGRVDVFLPDLKYLDAEAARKYSGVADYPRYAQEAVLQMARQAGPVVLDAQGLAVRGLIVRHLVLPGQSIDSLRVVDWLTGHLSRGCYISLMSQYVPNGRLEGSPELNRKVTTFEYQRVVRRLMDTGWEHAFVQEPGAADAAYTPDFDLAGVED